MKNAALVLLVGTALALAACAKEKGDAGKAGEKTPAAKKQKAPGPGERATSAVKAEGRRVQIDVTKTGYVPDRIEAAANEKLILVFTRTEDTECGRFVKVGSDPKTTELPLGEPVEIAFTMPEKGEVPFTCHMDMMKGVLAVAQD